MGHTFPKSQRLNSRIQKDKLLRDGKKIFSHPVLLRWLPRSSTASLVPNQSPPQVMMMVAKKKFPRAVDRNSIRRKLREAWRQHAGECLLGTFDFIHLPVFLVHYVATDSLSYVEIRKALCDALQKLPRQELQNLPRQELQNLPRQELQNLPRQELQNLPRQELQNPPNSP
jgi:ribonuclease P protein component